MQDLVRTITGTTHPDKSPPSNNVTIVVHSVLKELEPVYERFSGKGTGTNKGFCPLSMPYFDDAFLFGDFVDEIS